MTLSQPTNDLVIGVLNQITSDNMTTYEKVMACHDYLINSSSYGGKGETLMIDEGIMSTFACLEDYNAFLILNSHVGVCDDYTAAFVALTRAIGLESYIMGGQTTKASGGYTPHAWAVIFAGGQEYVFDPQIDDNLTKGGPISYIRFGKRYSEVPGKYIPDGNYRCVSNEFNPDSATWFTDYTVVTEVIY